MKAVGVPFMDGEHAVLLGVYRRSVVALLGDRDVSAFASCFEELWEYAADHFKHEEEMMLKVRYPDYPAHKRAHEKLIQSGEDLLHTIRMRFEHYDCYALILFIRQWLTNHVRDHDEKLAEFLVGLDGDDAATMTAVVPSSAGVAIHAQA